jgi:diacylglycerol kinase family enzyme
MTTSQSQYPSPSCYLTSAEKLIVFNTYLVLKSKTKYAECLQQFISNQYPQKKISLGYINKLVGRLKKRNPKETFLREIINARSSVIYSRVDTFKSQCEFCIEFSPTLKAAVNSR